jgi:hypothetical protein
MKEHGADGLAETIDPDNDPELEDNDSDAE